MILSIVTPPAAEPVSLAEAKLHLRIDVNDEDTLVESYITAAREWCELAARRAFVTQTLALRLAEWPCGDCIQLPRPPLASVTSITYTDSAGANQTMTSADYLVYATAEPGLVQLGYGKSWPSATLQLGPSIVITYVAGYGNAAAVPKRYKQAILLMTGHFYENREQVIAVPGISLAEVPLAVQSLLMIDRGSF